MIKHLSGILILLCLLGCQAENKVHEVIIIGGGLMGSSAAWHLSKSGKEVLVLEKQDSIYTEGSSYGEARIARSSNRGNDIWSYLHNRSVKETGELIAFLNNEDQSNPVKMEDIYTTSPVTYVGRLHIYDKLLASLVRQNVDYKMAITPQEGEEIFDVQLPDSILIQKEYNKHSGTINPKVLIKTLHRAVRKKGNQVRYNQQATGIKRLDNGFEINVQDLTTGNYNTLKAKNVISAAGPYTGILLNEIAPYFDKLINPQRVFLAFFRIKKETYNNWDVNQKQKLSEAYPVINSSAGTRDGSFFSMIEYLDEEGVPVIKIGGHFQRSDIQNLDEVWKKGLSDKEISWSKENTLRYFELLKLPHNSDLLELVDSYSCVYSLTQTEVPYVSNLLLDNENPDPHFVVLGGLSGVGAKGAMTYGLIATNLLLGIDEENLMYQKVKEALGIERLKNDIKNLD